MKKQFRKILDALVATKRTVIVSRYSRGRDGAFISHIHLTGVLAAVDGTPDQYTLLLPEQTVIFSARSVLSLGSGVGASFIVTLR